MRFSVLKELLDNLYIQYQSPGFPENSKDPVWNLHKFSDAKDIEIAGLITSSYAYGKVDLINRFVEKLFARIGNKPYEFTINFQKRKDKKFLYGLKYRFSSENNLINLFQNLSNILTSRASLKNLFLESYEKKSVNIVPSLTAFINTLNSPLKTISKNGKNYCGFLIPDSLKKSTFKRLNLFLRWMVRKDEIDLGVWDCIDKSKLIMPVDVHVARVSKRLNLVKRKSVDLFFALELTNSLKKFDPLDPVKYDFSLCHLGIDGKLNSLLAKI
ncbi:MAG: TIGR02757 family protein [Ignavibacteria bacterium]